MNPLDITIGSCDRGKRNLITDVDGITVGHCTLIKGKGPLIPGKGPVRTGVTVILPHQGNIYKEKLFAATYVANGYAKPIGLTQINELGVVETPLVLTNTLSVGVAADVAFASGLFLLMPAYTERGGEFMLDVMIVAMTSVGLFIVFLIVFEGVVALPILHWVVGIVFLYLGKRNLNRIE